MAASDTQVTIAGNLVEDPELRYTPIPRELAAAELRKVEQQEIDLLGLAAPRRSVTATIDASLDARLAQKRAAAPGPPR